MAAVQGPQRGDGERGDQGHRGGAAQSGGEGEDARGEPAVVHHGVADPHRQGDVQGLRVARPLGARAGPDRPQPGRGEPGATAAEAGGDGVDAERRDERRHDRHQQAGAVQAETGDVGDQPHGGRVQREERRRVALQGDQALGVGDPDQRRVVPVGGDLLVPPAVPAGQDVPRVFAAAEARVLAAEVARGIEQMQEDQEADQLQAAVQDDDRQMLAGELRGSAPHVVEPVPAGAVGGYGGGLVDGGQGGVHARASGPRRPPGTPTRAAAGTAAGSPRDWRRRAPRAPWRARRPARHRAGRPANRWSAPDRRGTPAGPSPGAAAPRPGRAPRTSAAGSPPCWRARTAAARPRWPPAVPRPPQQRVQQDITQGADGPHGTEPQQLPRQTVRLPVLAPA